MMRARVNRVMGDLRTASKEFMDQLSTDQDRVKKRSVWLAISEVFSGIISGIRNFFSYQEIQAVKTHSKLLTVKFNELSKNQEVLVDNQNYLSKQLKDIKQKFHLSLFVDDFVSRINHNLILLKKFTQALVTLQHGLTPISIFGHSEMQTVYEQLRDAAKLQGMTLTIESGVELYGAETSFFIENRTISIWQHVDCYQKENKFSLFEQLDLPLIKNGNSFELKGQSRFIGSTKELGSDKGIVIMENLESCKEFKARSYLCSNLKIWKSFGFLCEANLFIDNSIENCNLVPISTGAKYTYTFDKLLVFSFPVETEIAEICSEEVNYFTLKGIVKFNLKENCILHTDDFYLYGKFDSHFKSNLTTKHLLVSDEEAIKLEDIRDDDNNSNVIAFNHTQVEFESFDGHDYSQYIVDVVIVIIVVGIVVFLYLKSRRLVTQAN